MFDTQLNYLLGYRNNREDGQLKLIINWPGLGSLIVYVVMWAIKIRVAIQGYQFASVALIFNRLPPIGPQSPQ